MQGCNAATAITKQSDQSLQTWTHRIKCDLNYSHEDLIDMPQKNTLGWNPVKRSRRIGTRDQGFKARKDFDIPSSWRDDRIFWEKLSNPVALPHNIGDHEFTILIEPALPSYKYYVTISDLIEIIKCIPEDHRQIISVFAFRQPKRKEVIFSPVWGRLGYWADFGKYSGVSVLLEAQPINLKYKLEKNIAPNFMQEIDKLKQEGHQIELTKRHFEISSSPEAIRNTHIYRTLIHEIGHEVDYLEKVIYPAVDGEPDGDILDRRHQYDSRPKREKEDFAKRYVSEMALHLASKNIIPFDPLPISTEHRSKINPEWFYW